MSGGSNPLMTALLTSGVKGIASGLQTGGAANSSYAEAAIADENARRAILGGEQQVSQINRDARMAMGEQIAGQAGSGFVGGTGTAADLITASSMNAARDVANIRTRAAGQAQNYQMQADAKRASARASIINGMFGAVADALTSSAKDRANRLLIGATENYRGTVLGGSTLGVSSAINVTNGSANAWGFN